MEIGVPRSVIEGVEVGKGSLERPLPCGCSHRVNHGKDGSPVRGGDAGALYGHPLWITEGVVHRNSRRAAGFRGDIRNATMSGGSATREDTVLIGLSGFEGADSPATAAPSHLVAVIGGERIGQRDGRGEVELGSADGNDKGRCRGVTHAVPCITGGGRKCYAGNLEVKVEALLTIE